MGGIQNPYVIFLVVIILFINITKQDDLIKRNCSENPNYSFCKANFVKSNNTSVSVEKVSEKLNYNVDVSNYNVLDLWEKFPKFFAPVNSRNMQCARDSSLFLEGLRNSEMWALRMFDSTAKPPSGILNGNINQYGDFDQCLAIDDHLQGKYCLASVQIDLSNKPGFEEIDDLVHSHHYMRSNLTDLGHRIPRFSSILWGVCLPASCSGEDLEDEMVKQLKGLDAQVKVSNSMCSVNKQDAVVSFGKTIALMYFISIALLMFIGTVFDDNTPGSTIFERLLNCFSLRRNIRRLFDTSGQEQVLGVDGMRALNVLALLMAHKSMAMVYNPFVNRTRMSEVFGMPWAVIGRTAIVFTDSFLFISGLLNSYNLFNDLKKYGTIDFKGRIVARWFRLFPLLLGLIAFCTYILPDITNGPQWNLVVKEHGEICKNNMWKSFLFIHNFFGFETMCLTHTHQIGIDMQLYLFTPALVWLLWKKPYLGIFTSFAIGIGSTILRYVTVWKHNLSVVVYYGVSVQSLMNVGRLSYILPTHRTTVYIMGVLIAYLLATDKIKIKIPKSISKSLWFLAIAFLLWAWVGPWKMGLKGYVYTPGPAAQYAAFAPIACGLFMAWATWAINTGHGFFATKVLSFSFYKFINKIAYGIYLVQYPIFFYNVGVQRYSDFYKPNMLVYLPELLSIVAVSTLTTLSIEMPFNQIHKEFFSKSKAKTKAN